MRRKEMAAAIKRIGNELHNVMMHQPDEAAIDAKQVWTMLLNGDGCHEFRLSIWGSQRISYGAIFHAYENFIREAVGLAWENRITKCFGFWIFGTIATKRSVRR